MLLCGLSYSLVAEANGGNIQTQLYCAITEAAVLLARTPVGWWNITRFAASEIRRTNRSRELGDSEGRIC